MNGQIYKLRKLSLFKSSDPHFLLGVVVFVTCIVRVVAMLKFSDVNPATAQIWEYGQQSQCAIQTHGDLCGYYKDPALGSYPSAYMPPLLSYLWLILFKLLGDNAAARVAFLAIGLLSATLSSAILFRLSLRAGLSKLSALFTGIIFALYPTFVFVTTTYHQTNVAVMLSLVLVLVSVNAMESKSGVSVSAAGLGVIAGLAALNRSEMLVIGPAIIVTVAAWRRLSHVVVIGLVAFVLTLSPWIIRNYVEFDRFIPSAQSSGYNIWKGFNAFTNGSGNLTETSEGGNRELSRIRNSVVPGKNYEERMQGAYFDETRNYVSGAGGFRLAKLSINKMLLLWGFDWTDKEVTARTAYLMPWVVVNLLAAYGAFIYFRVGVFKWQILTIFGELLLLLTAAYTLTSVHSRYRMHIEPILFIFAGLGFEKASWLGLNWWRVRLGTLIRQP